MSDEQMLADIAALKALEKESRQGDWEILPCHAEMADGDCWCAVVGIAGEGEDGRGVIPSGSISKRDARYVVKLQNSALRIIQKLMSERELHAKLNTPGPGYHLTGPN